MDPERLSALMAQLGLPPDEQRSLLQGPSTGHRIPPQYHHGMSTEETAQYLKEYKEWFEEDRRISPERAPLLDRRFLISEQAHRRAELEATARRGSGASSVQFFMTMVGFSKHSSTMPIEHLHPVTFAGMLVRRAHVGQYLLCRIVAPCSRMVAIQTMIEDTDGVVHDLSIYNFPSTFDCTLQHIDALFPVGSVLAVREPTFKAPMQGTRPIVRVDSPTDITFVVPGSPLLRGVNWVTGAGIPSSLAEPISLDAWQKRGNAYFKASQWFLAAWAYSHGLAADPEAAVLYLNRAEAYLRLGYYSGAHSDAQRVLSMEGIPVAHTGKALFRLGKALYGRSEYEAAERTFVGWAKTHAEDSAADSWIDRCRSRQKEASTGQYDWAALFRTAKQKIRLDVANFIGMVEVSEMTHRGGGRGMTAKRDIRSGELLLVTKPFVSVYAPDLPKDKIIMTLDLISNVSKERTDAVLLARIIERLYGNPDLRDQVYHLYAGPDYPPPPRTYPPPAMDPTPVEPLRPNVDIDIAQLEAICTYNNFSPLRLEDNHPDKDANPTGLYPLASLFNHSCAANAVWYCIGDVMLVRAAQRIAAGEEITIPYCVEESYIDRQTVLKKHMLEHCTCWLCEEDRGDGEERIRRRHELSTNVVVSGKLLSASLAEARTFEKDVRETFAPTRGPVRPLSALALHVVAEKLRVSGNARLLREALQEDMNALRCYGFEVMEETDSGTSASGLPIGTDRFPTVTSFLEPSGIMLRIACTYLNLYEEADAVRWMKAALWLTDTSVGGGKELFLLIHERTLEQMEIREFAAQVL